MKVLFLDIDGPLAYGDEEDAATKIAPGLIIPYPYVEQDCKSLSEIIDKTGAKIILSSDWRLYYTIEEMNTILAYFGVPPVIIGETSRFKAKLSSSSTMDRAYQIMGWVDRHEPEKWVAVDDFDLQPYFKDYGYKDNFVRTRGIRNEDKTPSLTDVKDLIIRKLN